ncbi:M55 family metallopeptidase [Candidatus Poribacteria bacterium]|nr:M55 family metallopeptidase [Candidatus Poribacteria bacterium]
MKIYILTDLEGVAMVSRWDQTRTGDATPEAKAQAMKLLTWEVNAAIDGILDVYPDAEVIVWDGHGSGGIDIMEFHPKAKLIPRGRPIFPPYFLDESFDALFFVGQHAMAGTEGAPLCHTYSSKTIEYYKINGMFVGEFGARAIMAGTFGVPTVFISGDDKAVAEAKALVPNIHGAIVKWGLGIELAIHLSPKAAQGVIRRTAAEAVRDIGSIEPVRVDPPYEQEIRVYEGVSIEGYLKRGAEKIDDRTVVIRSDNICDLFI